MADWGSSIIRLNKGERSDLTSTNHNYYPLIESYRSGYVVSHIHRFENFELANDTLFPVYCPMGLVNNDPNDIVFWFHVSDDFIAELPEEKQVEAKRIQSLKNIKDRFPKVNLIDYRLPSLIDPSKFIELTNSEIFNFGFSIHLDTNKFREMGKTKMLRYGWNRNKTLLKFDVSKQGTQTFKYSNNNKLKDNPHLVYITNTMGDFKCKFGDEKLTESINLVPILIAKDSMNLILDDVLDEPTNRWIDEDYIYWFSINEQLFNALPEWLSDELKTEYNYIMAEDKSSLIKPECRFFDECRNTLEVSEFKVYPNPASSNARVSFNLPKSIDGRISLVDLTGHERQVLIPHTSFQEGNQQVEVDLHMVPEGIYLITLYSDVGVQSKRLIVRQ